MNYNIQYTGHGNIVISQSPKSGTSLEKNSVVRILLGEKKED